MQRKGGRSLQNKFKRGAAAAMAAAMLCGAIPAQAFTYDIAGHQAEAIMKEWIAEGYMAGDGNGYHPDQEITRAEFMTFANRVLKLTEEASIAQFQDVKKGDWYYSNVAKAYKAGYTSGTSGNTMSPNAGITNQEMYQMLSAMIDGESNADLSAVADRNKLAGWAENGVKEGISQGYIVGKDSKIEPTHKVTRAEAVVFLDRYKTDSRTFAYPGTYSVGSAGEVTVLVNGVTLKDTEIQGNLILDKRVQYVVLDNVTVGGQIIKGNPNVTLLAPGQWMDGDYAGVAQGDHGQIHVTVTFKENKIVEVRLDKHQEGAEGEKLMQPVLDQIRKTGGLTDIDLGPRKGITPEGLLNAVRDAAAQAGGQTVKPGQSSFAKEHTFLKDGTFMGLANGYGGKLKVKLVVKDHKVAELGLLEHTETPEYMVITQKLLPIIAEKGSVEGVDTITGATVTADALIHASQDALAQSMGLTRGPGQTPGAKQEAAEVNPDLPQGSDFKELTDGVYYGQAMGYGGLIKVTVTVTDQKIFSVEVTDHNETKSYYEDTEHILDEIVHSNSTNVDTVSGATATSRGILSAVEDALSEFMEERPYADGVWYGQGRGMYAEDAVDNRTKEIRNSRIEAKVTIRDGRIADVEMSYFGDDMSHHKPAAYDYISKRVVEEQGTKGLNELLPKVDENSASRDPSVDGFDAITGATRSSRGYVYAIEDALSRSQKYSKDHVEQQVRAIRLVNPPEIRQFAYGSYYDMSDLNVEIEYLDGSKCMVPFNQLPAYDITASLENPLVFAPEDTTDYAQRRKYVLELQDTKSTAKHATSFQASRPTEKIQITSIELTTDNGETVVIACDPDNFIYNTPKLEKHLKGISKENVKVICADGSEAVVGDVNIKAGYTPVITINLQQPKVQDSDPVYTRYQYGTFKIQVQSDARFDPTALTDYYVTSNPKKLTYSEGETLDLTGLKFMGTDDNYLQGEFAADKLEEYGFTVAPAQGEKLTAEDTQVVISMPGHEDVVFPLTVVAESTAAPHIIEIRSHDGKMLFHRYDLTEYKQEGNPDEMASWPVVLSSQRAVVPTEYKGHLDQLTVKIYDAHGAEIRNFTTEINSGMMKLSFSKIPEEMKYVMFGFKYEDIIAPMQSDVPHTIDIIGKDGQTVLFSYDLTAYKKPDNINEMVEWPVVLSSQRAVVPTEYKGHLDLLTFKVRDAAGYEISDFTVSLSGGMAKLEFSKDPEEMKYIMFGFKYEDPAPAKSNVPHTIDIIGKDGEMVLFHYDLSEYKKADNINEMIEWPVVLSSQRAVIPTEYRGHLDQLTFKPSDAAGNEITDFTVSLSGGMAKLEFSKDPEEMKYVMFGFKYVDPA